MTEKEQQEETQGQEGVQENPDREQEVEDLSQLIGEDYVQRMETPPFRKHYRS